MLEFIVLGQIPGTSVVITFSWAMSIITVVAGVSLLHMVRRERTVNHIATGEEASI